MEDKVLIDWDELKTLRFAAGLLEQVANERDALRLEVKRLQADSEVVARICAMFKIGINARSAACIMANVENTNRFAEKLHAIEREFFMVPGEPDEDYPDDEVQPECLLNCWGHSTEQYVERFREVLPRASIPEGFALVPVEPTEAMLAAGSFSNPSANRLVYEAMLAAAPQGDSHE